MYAPQESGNSLQSSLPGARVWKCFWVSADPVDGGACNPDVDEGKYRTLRDNFTLGKRRAVFVGPDGWPDPDLLRFTGDEGLGSTADGTQSTYAIEICAFLNFLGTERKKTDWCAATSEDLRTYEHFKRRDRSRPGRRVGGDTFDKILAAISFLYDWAVDERLLQASPVVRRRAIGEERRRPGRSTRGRIAQSSTVKNKTRVRWFTRRAVERWRQVAFEDYGVDGMPRGVERLRTGARNAAFVTFAYGTGLRRAEAGGLTNFELPAGGTDGVESSWVPGALAKGSRGRFMYVEGHVLTQIDQYVRLQRLAAIRRANSDRRYERLPGLRLITHVSGQAESVCLKYRVIGRVGTFEANLDEMAVADRMRLFAEGPEGLEPAWLWLKESGEPLGIDRWDDIFEQANQRCANQGLNLRVMPHMLRHSYALHMLIQAQRAYLIRFGMDGEERDRYQRLFGNVWQLVADLLGHASIETTKRWYLEPVRGLAMETLFDPGERGPLGDVDEVLRRTSQRSSLISDWPVEP